MTHELMNRFHDPRILAATGQGVAVESKRAWKGYWNEKLVRTCKQLFNDPEVLTVLLTGRSTLYVDIVNKILDSRNLLFDLVVLKPKRARGELISTLTFKYAFIDDVLRLGESIDVVEVYEDRAPHRDAFERYLSNWRRINQSPTSVEEQDGITVESVALSQENEELGLKSFKVHFVEMPIPQLDEEVEVSLISTMMKETNEMDMADSEDEYVLEKKVFNLGYSLDQDDYQRLFDTFMELTGQSLQIHRHEWRSFRNSSVFINVNAAPHVVAKVGGLGKRVDFEITHFGVSDKVLAVRVQPVASYHKATNENGDVTLRRDSHVRFWSRNTIPVLVLATRNDGRPIDANYLHEWEEVPKSVEGTRFSGRVTVRQEVSIIRAPKQSALTEEESFSPRKKQWNRPRSEYRRGTHQVKAGPEY
jgi:HAD domain family 1 in Swiss Army Knife RNA repair proteins